MLKKWAALTVIFLITPILAGLYGIVHDQLTYTISPEYYTKFKFTQFQLAAKGQAISIPERLGAAIVGFLATWWVGIPIALIFGAIALKLSDWQTMVTHIFQAYWKILKSAMICGLLGFVSSMIYLSSMMNHTCFFIYTYKEIEDIKSFLIVGTIHNFSYLGGLVGLIWGGRYLYKAD